MKSDSILTKELFLPPWKFCGASLFGDDWRVHVFYNQKCVCALSGKDWDEVLERAKAWAADADPETLEGGK